MNLDLLETILDYGQRKGATYVELRYEQTYQNSIETLKPEVGIENAIAMRVLRKGGWGSACSTVLTKESLKKAIDDAISSVIPGDVKLAEIKAYEEKFEVKPKKDLRDMSFEEKISFLKQLEAHIFDCDKRVKSVYMNYWDRTKNVTIYTSDGTRVTQKLPYVFLSVGITGKEGGKSSYYRHRFGGVGGMGIVYNQKPEESLNEDVKKVTNMLNAKPAPSGEYPFVAGPGLNGVFCHEAVGHLSESDHVKKGESVFEGKIGEKVAYKDVSISDSSLVPGTFGFFQFDDEGVRAREKQLIVKGYLKEFLANREDAYLFNLEPNGSARAEDWQKLPIVRMSNTFMKAGDRSRDEILEDIKYGIFADGTRGGQVSTTTGDFTFHAQESYLIEKGVITRPLRDVSLSSNVLEVLKKIDAVGKELRLGYLGFCGKGTPSQVMTVSAGGPMIRIKGIRVGGR